MACSLCLPTSGKRNIVCILMIQPSLQQEKEENKNEEEEEGKEEEEKSPGAMVPAKDVEGASDAPASTPGARARDQGGDVQASTSYDEATRVCEARVGVRLSAPKLLMLKLVEQVAADTVVKATPGAPDVSSHVPLPVHSVS